MTEAQEIKMLSRQRTSCGGGEGGHHESITEDGGYKLHYEENEKNE